MTALGIKWLAIVHRLEKSQFDVGASAQEQSDTFSPSLICKRSKNKTVLDIYKNHKW